MKSIKKILETHTHNHTHIYNILKLLMKLKKCFV